MPCASSPRAQASRPLRLPVPTSARPPAINRVRRCLPVFSPRFSGRHQTKPLPDLKGRMNACLLATICWGVTRMPPLARPRRPRSALKPVGIARNFRPPLGRIMAPFSKASTMAGTLDQTSPAAPRLGLRGKVRARQALPMPRPFGPKAALTWLRKSSCNRRVSSPITREAARAPPSVSSFMYSAILPVTCATNFIGGTSPARPYA